MGVAPQNVHQLRVLIKHWRALYRLRSYEHSREGLKLRQISRALAPFRDEEIARELLRELKLNRKEQRQFQLPKHTPEERRRAVLHAIRELKKIGIESTVPKGEVSRYARELAPGLKRSRRRFKRLRTQCARDPKSDELLHRWRRRTKDLQFELEMMGRSRRKSKKLARVARELGRGRDCAVLLGYLRSDAGKVKKLRKKISRKRRKHYERAIRLG